MLLLVLASLSSIDAKYSAPFSHFGGLNYYAGRNEGWSHQWLNYPAIRPRIISDLDIAQSLGASFLRTFVQSEVVFAFKCNATLLDRIDDFLGLSYERGMGVIIGFDKISTSNISEAYNFISCLATRFNMDKRIIVWELLNEADSIPGWISNGLFSDEAVAWFKSTTSHLSSISSQPLTISMITNWNYLKQLCSILPHDYYIPQMHTYPAFDPTNSQTYIQNIRTGVTDIYAACSKCLYIGEWGRPGHSNATPCLGQSAGQCSEENQDALFLQFANATSDLIEKGLQSSVFHC